MVGKSYYAYFNDSIGIGKNFSDEDFEVNSSDQEVNVILGNEYMEFYSIGDVMELSLHKKIKFYEPDNKYDEMYQNIYCSQKNSCFIKAVENDIENDGTNDGT